MTPNGIFITGTDTGVGKTRVAAALLLALRERGEDAWPMKPIQTGGDDDLAVCLSLAGLRADDELRGRLGPYRFPLAASPHLAARAAGARIETPRIAATFRELAARHGPIVVEGAGGLLVPLDGGGTVMADLIGALEIPVLVVARAGLGTLNHCLLTVQELWRRGLPCVGLVLNSAVGGGDVVKRDNESTLRDWLKPLPVVTLPFDDRPTPDTRLAEGRRILDELALA